MKLYHAAAGLALSVYLVLPSCVSINSRSYESPMCRSLKITLSVAEELAGEAASDEKKYMEKFEETRDAGFLIKAQDAGRSRTRLEQSIESTRKTFAREGC